MPAEDIARVTYQNLLLMGFDPADTLVRFGIEVTEGTLLEAAGMQRQIEIFMHFVILKCFPEVAPGMKLHWPIVEKAQARDFRKLVTDKLTILQKEHEIPPNPVIRSTLMDSPTGPKILSVLFYTTQAAMRRGLAQMKQTPAISLAPYNPRDGPSLERLAHLHASRQRKKFLSRLADISAAHKRWAEFGDSTAEAYKVAVRERERVKEDLDALMAGPHTNVMWAVAESARKETASRDVGGVWKKVQGHVSHVSGQMRAAEEVLLDERSRPCIDVDRLRVGVPSPTNCASAPIVFTVANLFLCLFWPCFCAFFWPFLWQKVLMFMSLSFDSSAVSQHLIIKVEWHPAKL